MIQTNNKRNFLILTTAVSLLLLAQSVQAQFEIRIFPKNLDFIPSSNAEQLLKENSKFCWRNIRGKSGSRRVLTIEEGTADLQSDLELTQVEFRKIMPHQLAAYYDYTTGLDLNKAKFNIREKTRNGETFKVVTIEDVQQTQSVTRTDEVSPFNFVGTANFRDSFTDDVVFNWRFVTMDDGIEYRAVTIEKLIVVKG